jgi:hypothetical protein
MDGSRSEEGIGFGIYVPGQQGFGYRLQEPSGVFTVEITALLTALRFVRSSQLGEFLILADSLSSIEALRSIDGNGIGVAHWSVTCALR